MSWLRRCMLPVSLAFSMAVPAQGVAPAFDPLTFKQGIDGKPNQVLVLGTAHLAALKTLELRMLEPLLQRLQAYIPQVITIEAVSGIECDLLQRYAATYPGTWEMRCVDLAAARKATGLEAPQAQVEAEKLLASWPKTPTPAQRRRLAAVFLSAGEPASAAVQWMRLEEAERKAEDGIDAESLKFLAKVLKSRNESYSIAATLAARLGLERVYATNDHTADATVMTVLAQAPQREAEYGEFLKRHFDAASAQPFAKEFSAKEQAAVSSGDSLLEFYRFMNSPRVVTGLVANDFNRASKTPSAQHYGRLYMAWWETRNLRMVANIRQVMGVQPVRVLAVVGASHKAHFDAYLDLMHDVQLVDAAAVLK